MKKVVSKDPLLKKLHSMCFGKPGKAQEVKVRGMGLWWRMWLGGVDRKRTGKGAGDLGLGALVTLSVVSLGAGVDRWMIH